MRIFNTSCEGELSWSNVLRHLKGEYRQNADVVFCCGDGGTVEGNLMLMSRSSKLLQNVVAEIPSYRGSLETNGLLQVVLPDYDRSTVERWIHLIYEGTVSVSEGAQVDEFAEFLEKVIVFTGDWKLSLDDVPVASAGEAGGTDDIRILNFGSLSGSALDALEAVSHVLDEHLESDGVHMFAEDLCQLRDTLPVDLKSQEGSEPAHNQAKLLHGDLAAASMPVFADDFCELKCSESVDMVSDEASATEQQKAVGTGLFKCKDAALVVEGQQKHKVSIVDGNCSKPRSHVGKPLECPNCGQKVKDIYKLLQHASSKHYAEAIMQKCTFVSKSELSCNLCCKTCQTKDLLIRHVGSKHGVLGHITTGTDQSFFSSFDPNYATCYDIVRKKMSLPFFMCPECTSMFSSLPLLYEHAAACHYRQELITRYGMEGSCLICGNDLGAEGDTDLAVHYGSIHKKIEDLMTPERKEDYREAAASGCLKRKQITEVGHVPSKPGRRVMRIQCPECPKMQKDLPSLYRHSAGIHYYRLIRAKYKSLYDEQTGCHLCNMKQRSVMGRILHFGYNHKMVLQCMDEETRKKYTALES